MNKLLTFQHQKWEQNCGNERSVKYDFVTGVMEVVIDGQAVSTILLEKNLTLKHVRKLAEKELAREEELSGAPVRAVATGELPPVLIKRLHSDHGDGQKPKGEPLHADPWGGVSGGGAAATIDIADDVADDVPDSKKSRLEK